MHNVVIVGAGPAGLSAALAAAAAGAPVLLIDSNPRLGGQYWRMPQKVLVSKVNNTLIWQLD